MDKDSVQFYDLQKRKGYNLRESQDRGGRKRMFNTP